MCQPKVVLFKKVLLLWHGEENIMIRISNDVECILTMAKYINTFKITKTYLNNTFFIK